YDLLESDRLSDEEKRTYRQLINVDTTGKELYAMPDATLMGSLKKLSVLLEKHYGSKVVILIDEYDVPLAKANEQGYYDQMLILIRNMFEQALKTNNSLYFAVLTGCLRVSKESIFTGLNNMKVFSITDEDCGTYFGFTNDEVREMLEYYDLAEKYELIKEWYDGYRFGDTDVYCPWDVIYYVDKLQIKRTLQPQNYWSNTSSNDILKQLLMKASSETRDEIERLIAGETVVKRINEELTYKELYDNIENVWSVLLATGYLTQQGEAGGRMRRLVIPNREIHDIFMTQIRGWMQDKAREDKVRLNAFCEAFRNADGETVQSLFTEYLNETVSVRDTAVRKELKENFYHGFLLGLLRFKEDWKVLSNRESGQGYADIVVEIFSEKTGIVIEVKYAENGDLDGGCREAMNQIEREGYANQPNLDGMSRVIKCGIACHVKNCRAVFEVR
ncbi:MAG: ATP-binding protein, partial [Acetatifactor sp.]|nr:ATP-binding protein [Acetatifactor sp.]